MEEPNVQTMKSMVNSTRRYFENIIKYCETKQGDKRYNRLKPVIVECNDGLMSAKQVEEAINNGDVGAAIQPYNDLVSEYSRVIQKLEAPGRIEY